MNRTHHLRLVRRFAALAGLACAWLGLAGAASAAFAVVPRLRSDQGYTIPASQPPGWPPLPPGRIYQPRFSSTPS